MQPSPTDITYFLSMAEELRRRAQQIAERYGQPPLPDPRLDQIIGLLHCLTARIDHMSQTNQEHADSLAAQLTAMDEALKAGIPAILAEIAALKATSPPTVDFTALDTAVANLGTDVAAAVAIPAAPPA